MDLERVKEECNQYRGKCSNLQRDIQVSQSYLQKMSTDTNSVNEQQSYLKDRVRNLEGDLERALREKTDAVCEVRRLTTAKEQLEKQLSDLKITQMQAKGDSQTVGATAHRLQATLQGKQQDIDLLMRSKEELEKLVQQVKSETLEAERKSADYYQQLLRATENFQIIQSEQKLLS